MAYIINKTNGTVVATIADGTIDLTSTSLGLVGRHYPTYGETINENMIKLMENFSNSSGPAAPLKGQLWFDSSANTMNVNISDNPVSPQWLSTTKILVSSTGPLVTVDGTVWFDTTNQTLKIRSNNAWASLKTLKSGDLLPNVADSASGDVFFNEATNQSYVFSPTARYTNAPGWDALGVQYASTQPSTIKDGELWFNTTNKQLMLYSEALAGNAAGSEVIGPVFSKAITHGKSGTFGVVFEGHPVLVEMLDGEPISLVSAVRFTHTGGIIDGINFSSFPSPIEKGINLTTDNDAGVNPPRFNGPASSLAADIAERFHSDVDVEPGDIVKIGGAFDVTKTTSSLDQDVFGVVSTNPAYMMNAGLGEGSKFPFIALDGRIPVKVVGPVKKGQRLVSSNTPGVARAIENNQVAASYVSVFGRALETNDDPGIKLIDAVVGSK